MGAGAMSELPPGFVLDSMPSLPAGFILDKPSYGEDLAKSAGSGLANLTASAIGAIGDARSGMSGLTDMAGDALGISRDKVQAFKDLASKAAYALPAGRLVANAPTSRDVINAAPNAVVSPDYKPQTVSGDLLKTGIEFAPAMIGGPESMAAKLLTRVAAPAAASVAAGQATSGTGIEPYARMGGALLGGAGASKLFNAASEARALKGATPALDTLKADTSAGYDALTTGNVATPLKSGALDALADDIRDTLNRTGKRPVNAGSIHTAVDQMRSPATAGAPDVADLVASRQSIKELLGTPDTNKAGAFVALGKIERAIEQASPGTMQELRSLDKNWGAVKANEALDKKLARAELNNAGAHSGFNLGNQIRQQVKNLLNSNQAKYLSEETKDELTKVVKGTWTSNGIRAVSKIFGAGGGLGALIGAGEGYREGGLAGAIAAGALGRGLGHADAVLTARRAARAAEAIRRASPMGQSKPLMLPPPTNTALSALMPALLARPL